MGFDPAQSVDRVVGYARSQGLERFAGLIPNGDYGRRASQALIASVERGGGRMVAMQPYDRSREALHGAVTRLNAQSGYDAVLIAVHGRLATGAAPMVREGTRSEERRRATEGVRKGWYRWLPQNHKTKKQ